MPTPDSSKAAIVWHAALLKVKVSAPPVVIGMANAIPSFPPMAVPDNVEAFPSESETVKEAPFCLQIMKTVFVAVILLEKLKLVPPEELLYCWIVAGIAYAPLVPLMICACAEALGVVKVFVFEVSPSLIFH